MRGLYDLGALASPTAYGLVVLRAGGVWAKKGSGLVAQVASSQFSRAKPGTREKWAMLFVTTVNPRLDATPAMRGPRHLWASRRVARML